MTRPGPGHPAPVLAAVKAMPCGRPAAGLDSGLRPALNTSGRERPTGKTHTTTRSASRENRVSTKPGAVQPRPVLARLYHVTPRTIAGAIPQTRALLNLTGHTAEPASTQLATLADLIRYATNAGIHVPQETKTAC
jgi:hypothetical protein